MSAPARGRPNPPPWYKRTAVIVAFIMAGGGVVGTVGTSLVAALDDPPAVVQPINCGDETDPYFERQTDFPALELAVDENSELNKQCDLNEQLELLRDELALDEAEGETTD